MATGLASCYPNKTATLLSREEIPSEIKSPTKVFLSDASVILFQNGFTVTQDILSGNGSRHWINGEDRIRFRSIPLDSISALTYYDLKHSGGEVLASVFLGLYGGTLTPLSIYCLVCPK